jgi:outer membrane protein assembly factor BamB
MHAARIVRTVLATALTATPLFAGPGDWPGFRGADRTGVSQETGLLKEWPKGGPKLAWKATGLGSGYATPSIASGVVYLLGTKGEREFLIALSAQDGKRLWETEMGRVAGQNDRQYPGPRSTPTIDGDVLYVIGSDGKLVCAELKGGKVRWHKDLKADFRGQPGNWAYAESPLVDGDVLVCTPGGQTSTLVALKKKTGDVIWKSVVTGSEGGGRQYATAGYASVIIAEVDGVKQYIQFLSGGVVGVAAKDGKLLWHYDKPANRTANCSTPIFHDGRVLAASGYGTGGGCVQLKSNAGKFEAEEVYFVKELQNHHGGIVLVGDHVYGTGANSLLCIDFKTGKIAWQERGVGKGSVAYADGHLYVRSENGPVALVEASPSGYKEKGRFDQPERSNLKSWPYPVIAGGKMYLRDQDILLCYDVKAAGMAAK